jgi:sugar lactone lactonase YvrE
VIETPVREPARQVVTFDEEALFREARQLRRRRWGIRIAILLALVAVGVGVVALTAARGHARVSSADHTAGALPNGSLTSLHVAGALAVGPSGALYVADTKRHRVLVRLPDGRFRVIAGDGVDGYSGDGGSALHAELSTISGLAFSPAGNLYTVDGGRVRVITPAGVIHTIAGDGRPDQRIGRPTQLIAAGTPARSAALGTAAANAGPSIAFAPNGTLYITTAGTGCSVCWEVSRRI